MSGIGTAFAFGFIYFMGAIPAGVIAGLPAWGAAIAAWAGYSTGAASMIIAGASVRLWLVRRFRISLERDPAKWLWKAWDRWGLIGLGLLAPVTIGPQIGGILALAVGEKPFRTFLSFSLGVVPWCIFFAIFVAAGVKLIH